MSTRLGRKVDELCQALEELAGADSVAAEWRALNEVADHLGMHRDDVQAAALYGVKMGRLRVEGDPPHSVAIESGKDEAPSDEREP